uniref:Uncharacterized protein n=1 Tax=Anopheles dirus TaxID=7168 RepID=A0A182NVD8_9DIPT
MAISSLSKPAAITAISLLLSITAVKCIENYKTRPSIHESSDRRKTTDAQTSGSSLWAPEYYDGPDAYKKDFITSSYEDKFSNNNPLYPTPFSSGSLYSSGGLYDRRPSYGTARPIDYGVHDYDNPYDNVHQTQGYGWNYPYGPKELQLHWLLIRYSYMLVLVPENGNVEMPQRRMHMI